MQIDSAELFIQTLSNMIVGASYQVNIAISTRSPVFHLVVNTIFQLIDQRISSRARIVSPPKPSKDDEANLVWALDVLNHAECHTLWGTSHSNMCCIISDNEIALLTHQCHDGPVTSCVLEGKDCEAVYSFFLDYWEGSGSLLFEDFFRTVQPDIQKGILVTSNKFWSELISELKQNPSKLYNLPPRRFEELVAELLDRMGHDVTLTPETRDGGYDIIATAQDSIGKHLYLVECKRYSQDKPVGVGIVRALNGVVETEKASGGLIVTTSKFTSIALKEAEKVQYRISLRGFEELKSWLNNSLR